MLEQAALSFCGLSSPSVEMYPEALRLASLEILYGRPPPSDRKAQGLFYQQLAELEMSRNLQALEKFSAI